MTMRPILFSGRMVRAIIAGTKTQTRRVVKLPGVKQGFPMDYRGQDVDRWREVAHGEWQGMGYVTAHPGVLAPCHDPFWCPYGGEGDRLWVREAYRLDGTREGQIIYRATAPTDAMDAPCRWRPSIHMPRRASRLTLEVTCVRVERVREITPEDCLAEGIEWQMGPDSTRLAYMELWDSINAARGYGWAANPWVWVVEFLKMES